MSSRANKLANDPVNSEDIMRELVGHEPEQPDIAAERDIRDIMSRMGTQFDDIIATLVRGSTN